MKQGSFKYIEQLLNEYPDMDKYISLRIEELKYPNTIEADQNIGGGSSGFVSNPTERMVMTIVDDKRLKNIELNKQAIDKVLFESDELTAMIIRMYYFNKPRLKTWEGIALAINVSEGHCRKLRTRFFEKIADELGLPI